MSIAWKVWAFALLCKGIQDLPYLLLSDCWDPYHEQCLSSYATKAAMGRRGVAISVIGTCMYHIGGYIEERARESLRKAWVPES
jgi:hypothetical protein